MIRVARQDDAEWIAKLWNTIITDTLFTFTTVPKSPPEISEIIETRRVLVLSDRAGFATYGPFRGGPGYAATVEHTIILAPIARGAGQGKTLLTALCDRAAADGHHVTVAGISSANPGAVTFHARIGFVEVGRLPEVGRKNGTWLDLILMQKFLNPPDFVARSR